MCLKKQRIVAFLPSFFALLPSCEVRADANEIFAEETVESVTKHHF